MGARVPLILGSVAVFTLAIVAFVATKRPGACDDCGEGSHRPDPLRASLVATLLEVARSDWEDKDYSRAIGHTERILTLDPHNPEALAIHEQAASAIREIATLVASTREAMLRSDSAQAAALDRVLMLDPKNPIVAELSSRLNANFSTRAAAARSEMEKARSVALAKKGADEAPAFAEGEKFSITAGQSLADREFTLATQTFVQARDAYDRARRDIEYREREAIEDNQRRSALALPVQVKGSPPPPWFMLDCSWTVEAHAWVDSDRDGVWDKQEEPLPGVQFRLGDYAGVASDNRGVAHWNTSMVSCGAGKVPVSALPPPAYEPTTKQPVLVRGAGDAGTVLFGFRHVR